MSFKTNIGTYRRINAAGTYLVKSGNGTLYRIVVGTTAVGTITIYDDTTAASGSEILVLKPSIQEGSYSLMVGFLRGLTVVMEANSDITVIYE